MITATGTCWADPLSHAERAENAEELLAAAAVLDQLREIAAAAREPLAITHRGRSNDALDNIPAGEQT